MFSKIMTNQSKIITIPHLGAETCVTGSCHLVPFQPDHDCGIAQGHDPQVPLDRFPVPPTDIDSPLGIRITRLYQEMEDCWDREAKTLKAAI